VAEAQSIEPTRVSRAPVPDWRRSTVRNVKTDVAAKERDIHILISHADR